MVIWSKKVALVPDTLVLLGSIGDRDGLLDKVVEKYGLSVGTTMIYAYSMGKFVDFLFADWSLVKPWSSKEDFLQICNYVHQIKRNVAKEHRQLVPEDKPGTVCEKDIPTVEMVRGYFRSNAAQKIIEVLTGVREYTASAYRRLISHILLEICFSNAKRSGDICNMTMQELADARHQDGLYIVRVKKHKVKSKSCLMALTPTVYKWLLRLTHDEPWRPSNSDKFHVFVTTSGVKLKSSQLSDCHTMGAL
jgi:hypothetical protein